MYMAYSRIQRNDRFTLSSTNPLTKVLVFMNLVKIIFSIQTKTGLVKDVIFQEDLSDLEILCNALLETGISATCPATQASELSRNSLYSPFHSSLCSREVEQEFWKVGRTFIGGLGEVTLETISGPNILSISLVSPLLASCGHPG